MEIEDWAKAVKRIRATGTRLPDEQAETLWDEFRDFDAKHFHRAVDGYVMAQNPPRNLIAYFRDTVADIKRSYLKWEESRFEGGSAVSEVSYEQHNLFWLCLCWAVDIYTGDDFYGWNQVFSEAWNKLTGERLTRYLADEVQRLIDASKQAKASSVMDLAKRKTDALKRLAEYRASREAADPVAVATVPDLDDDFDDSKLPF